MPYTPPSHSPASSPAASRRSSYSSSSAALPRSASYLRKHRRSPSAPAQAPSSSPSTTQGSSLPSTSTSWPQDSNASLPSTSSSTSSPLTTDNHNTACNNKQSSSSSSSLSSLQSSAMATATMTMTAPPAPLLGPMTLSIPAPLSIHQSPSPIGSGRTIPPGAVLSPPESASDSDEDGLEIRGRDRQSLKTLKNSIRPTTMEVSPDIIAANSNNKPESPSFVLAHRPSNTATESTNAIPRSSENAIDCTDEETDTEKYTPKMVRKKSGELVRPALRASSRSRRANSAPGTPTMSKAVHFDSQLERVRLFMKVDRPAAVSAGSSPVETYDSETEYPFYDHKPAVEPPFSWEMVTTNFPVLSAYRKAQPICLEKVWLSSDQKSLVGSVAVANMAFQKLVVCRFTFDYWKTTSEVVADYSEPIEPRVYHKGTDRFTFAIRLSDTADLQNKIMYFCMRYHVDGTDYWDNNTNLNFQVGFHKKYQKQNGKNGFQGNQAKPTQSQQLQQQQPQTSGGLPRSSRRPANLPGAPPAQATPPKMHARSMSMPAGLGIDGAAAQEKSASKATAATSGSSSPPKANTLKCLLDDEPITLRLKPKRNTSPDSQSNGSANSMAFSNRYDFGASLSAARMEPNPNKIKVKTAVRKQATRADMPVASGRGAPGTSGGAPRSMPGAFSYGGMSHEEIINKFCFFGSKPTTTTTTTSSTNNNSKSYHGTCAAAAPRSGQSQPAKPNAQAGSHGYSAGSASTSTSASSTFGYSKPQHAGPSQRHHIDPVQQVALQYQQAVFGFPPNRGQASGTQMQQQQQSVSNGFVPSDGTVTPSTPISSNGSSPTITSASTSPNVSPTTTIPTGIPSIKGLDYKATTGIHDIPFEKRATAITG